MSSSIIAKACVVFMFVAMMFLYWQYRQTQQQLQLVLAQQNKLESLHSVSDVASKDDPYLKRQVKNTVIKNASVLQGCYNRYLELDPEVKDGSITLDWQIDTQGNVFGSGVVRSSFREQNFHGCLLNVVNEVRFPIPHTTKYVEHTLTFKREETLKRESIESHKPMLELHR